MIYHGAKSQVQTAAGQSKPFRIKTGVHQGLVLSPLLFIIVMDALTEGLKRQPPWALLYDPARCNQCHRSILVPMTLSLCSSLRVLGERSYSSVGWIIVRYIRDLTYTESRLSHTSPVKALLSAQGALVVADIHLEVASPEMRLPRYMRAFLTGSTSLHIPDL
ncbi:unnamed protein product [Strongylus vulgaris]|uniref:Reverse transcriptase domain-containing protein n=1 Tax=Strongylus vulgaris TaxID=40348 RepID=A0A3P7JIW5_STRVU|nr:unnamed protein product [Strongylus vulgaris]